MTAGGWCRTLRAGVFAAACVLLAALGHVMMSGTGVPWWAVVAGTAATGTAGWFLAGRERGRTLIVTVVVAAQMLLHETFSFGQGLTAGATPVSGMASSGMTGMTGMAGMDMGSSDAMDMSGMAHMAHMAHGSGGMAGVSSGGMLAAHLIAALLCGLWLAYGERAVFRVLRAAAVRLAAPLRMLLALPVPARPLLLGRHRPAHRSRLARFLLCYSVTSRGPPAGVAVS